MSEIITARDVVIDGIRELFPDESVLYVNAYDGVVDVGRLLHHARRQPTAFVTVQGFEMITEEPFYPQAKVTWEVFIATKNLPANMIVDSGSKGDLAIFFADKICALAIAKDLGGYAPPEDLKSSNLYEHENQHEYRHNLTYEPDGFTIWSVRWNNYVYLDSVMDELSNGNGGTLADLSDYLTQYTEWGLGVEVDHVTQAENQLDVRNSS